MAIDLKVPDISRPFGLKLEDILKADNIAELLTEPQLMNIGSDVKRDFLIDKVSRADKEDKIDKAMDLAMQVVEKKNYPWANASNVKYPLLTQASLDFASKAMPAVVTSFGVCKGKVIGNDDGVPQADEQGQQIMVGQGEKQKRADRQSTMVNYQLSEDMEEWEDDTDKLMHTLPIVGSMFRKSFYDATLGRNSSTLIFPKHFVINVNAKDLESCPRYTHILDSIYSNDIEERIRLGVYVRIEYGTASTPATEDDEVQTDDNAPHTFLEQHKWLDLDDDGYQEPYIVTVHEETGNVVRIERRFDAESIVSVDGKEIAKIKADTFFTKYGFIPSFDGSFYDTGFGELLMPLNESINSSLNQMFDAGHLNIVGGGFMGKGIRMKGGAIRQRPGQYQPVNVSGGTLRENIYELRHPEPSIVLFQLLGLLEAAGKDIAGTQNILGDAAGNQATFTTMAIVEEGAMKFKGIYKRLHRALRKEIKKLVRLNYYYLSDDEYMNVIDEQASVREDFNYETCDVVPVTDPETVLNSQKMTKAQLLIDFKDDPFLNPIEIRERVLEAAGIENLDTLIVQPQPQGTDPLIEVEQYKAETTAKKNDKEFEAKEAQFNLDRDKLEFDQEKLEFDKYKAEQEEILKRLEIESKETIEMAKIGAVQASKDADREKDLLAKRLDLMTPEEQAEIVPPIPQEMLDHMAEMARNANAEKEIIFNEEGRPTGMRVKEQQEIVE